MKRECAERGMVVDQTCNLRSGFGAQGIIVEITDSIPDTCQRADHRGKPGMLVYWCYLSPDGAYKRSLSEVEAKKAHETIEDGPAFSWHPFK